MNIDSLKYVGLIAGLALAPLSLTGCDDDDDAGDAGTATAGETDGATDGTTEGTTDGTTEGTTDGTTEGTTDGTTEGTTEGTTAGETGGGLEPGQCGGADAVACANGEVCVYGDMSCGLAAEIGACEALPAQCKDIDEPVCGCDGMNYANACGALAAGVDVAATGECA